MKQKVRKLFFIWNLDKEDRWLNEMSSKGLQLCEVGVGKYVFEEGRPNQYTYRLQLLKKRPKSSKSVQYIRFIEDTGAEFIGSMGNKVYFRKNAADGRFDIFSDMDSQIKQVNRVLYLTGMSAALFLLAAATQFLAYNNAMRVRSTQIAIFGDQADLSAYSGAMNLALALVTLAFFGLAVYSICKQLLKRRRLKKERALRE